jgi:hypothetical protein
MLQGRFSIIGAVEVDGEQLCGAFIECTEEQLREHRALFAEEVAITPAQSKVDSASTNTQSTAIAQIAAIIKKYQGAEYFKSTSTGQSLMRELRQLRAL